MITLEWVKAFWPNHIQIFYTTVRWTDHILKVTGSRSRSLQGQIFQRYCSRWGYPQPRLGVNVSSSSFRSTDLHSTLAMIHYTDWYFTYLLTYLLINVYRINTISNLALFVEQSISRADRWSWGHCHIWRRMNVNSVLICIKKLNLRQSYKPLVTPVWQQFYIDCDWSSPTPPTSRLSHCLAMTATAVSTGMFIRRGWWLVVYRAFDLCPVCVWVTAHWLFQRRQVPSRHATPHVHAATTAGGVDTRQWRTTGRLADSLPFIIVHPRSTVTSRSITLSRLTVNFRQNFE